MEDKKITNMRSFTKLEELDKWLKDLVFPGKVENFIQDLDAHSLPGVEQLSKICFYTEKHQYIIKAVDRTKDDGYLGCVVQCRKPRPGEDWLRGNDLPDGKFNKATWDLILKAIISYEIVKLSDYKKPEVGDINYGDDIREE